MSLRNKVIFFHLHCTILVILTVILFLKSYLIKKDKINFDKIAKTNEEYISVTYGCIRFIDSYRFLSMKLDEFVEKLDNENFKFLGKESVDKWQYLNKNLAYPYEYFNKIDDYKKPMYNLKKDYFVSEFY